MGVIVKTSFSLKNILVLLIAGLLFSGPTLFCGKRKRSSDSEDVDDRPTKKQKVARRKKKKKRKSIYDQYLGEDGKYYCYEPGCEYPGTDSLKTFKGHLRNERHGHLKGVKKGIEDFFGSLASSVPKQGQEEKEKPKQKKKKKQKKQKKKSIYDQYLGEDGKYHD